MVVISSAMHPLPYAPIIIPVPWPWLGMGQDRPRRDAEDMDGEGAVGERLLLLLLPPLRAAGGRCMERVWGVGPDAWWPK